MPGLPKDKKISEVLIYVFFSSLPNDKRKGPIVRSCYELFTTSDKSGAPRYSRFMNTVFNQPDTVIESANIWLPYTDGKLRVRLPWSSGPIPEVDCSQLCHDQRSFKHLDECMKAFAGDNDHTIFNDLFLLGYRLAE